MKKLGIILTIIFLLMVAFYIFVLAPEKYEDKDAYEAIQQRGKIKVGINTDSKPFGFFDDKWEVQGYDADLARYLS